jgi:hypothetical protein
MTLANTPNLNSTTPAAPSGNTNIIWQDDGGAPTVNISAYADLASAQSSVSGSVSGTAVFQQQFIGSQSKRIMISLQALNGTASYTFPMPFSEVPDFFVGGSAAGATVTALSTAAVTVSGAPSSGVIVLEGY